MEEEEYRRYLQPLQPMLPVGEGWASSAIVVPSIPESQRLAYETQLNFGRGQTVARALREGRLSRDNQGYAYRGQKYPKRGYSVWAHDGWHDPGVGSFLRVNENTPLVKTKDYDNYAIVRDGDDPTKYFTVLETRNGIGYSRPSLRFDDIEGIPEPSQRNVRAHQILNGLRTALREYGVTDDELRSVGIDGYDGIGPDALYRIRGKKALKPETKIMRAVSGFMGSNGDYTLGNLINNDDIDRVTNFLRENYRPGKYYSMPEGVPERTRLYAKGGAMPKAAPERIRHEGRILSRVGGNDREDWYL